MTTVTANPVATYRDRVATALADVPVDERAEALDGVSEHLAEVTRGGGW